MPNKIPETIWLDMSLMSSTRRFFLVSFVCLCLSLSSLMLAGCKDTSVQDRSIESVESKTVETVTDAAGRSVAKGEYTHIITLSSSFLEPLHALDASVIAKPVSSLVDPDWARDIESVGTSAQIDIEKVVSLHPDLVLIRRNMQEKYIPILEENGISCLVLEMKSYEDVKRDVTVLSEVLGEKVRGDAIIKSLDDEIAETTAKIPSTSRRVAILHGTSQGLSIQLEGSIAGSVVSLLGWENVAKGLLPLSNNPDAAPYSMETLVEKNPEIIFVTSMGEIASIKADMDARMADDPAWQSIPAVREGKVYYLPKELFLLSPSIDYPRAVEYMARCVYPELVWD